ncbi:MAG: PEP-CTERM sorting domain-containing protein [Acidobacteriota bacterium]
MKRFTVIQVGLLGLLLAGGEVASAAPILISISGDTQQGPLQGIPRQVNQINTANSTAGELYDLGDGSQGFIGGLTFRPLDALLYSIHNDGYGSNTMVAFAANGGGSFDSFAHFLPDGFFYGLTYCETLDRFYALYTQGLGYVTFMEIDAAGQSATPVFDYAPAWGVSLGGMTWGPSGLEGLFINEQGQWQIHQIDLGGQQVTAVGQGFGGYLSGGFYYDPAAGTYYAIDLDFSANGTLVTLDPGTGTASAQFGVGQGYYYGALTSIADELTGEGPGDGPGGTPGEVPEPGTWAMAGIGIILLAASHSRRRQKHNQ